MSFHPRLKKLLNDYQNVSGFLGQSVCCLAASEVAMIDDSSGFQKEDLRQLARYKGALLDLQASIGKQLPALSERLSKEMLARFGDSDDD